MIDGDMHKEQVDQALVNAIANYFTAFSSRNVDDHAWRELISAIEGYARFLGWTPPPGREQAQTIEHKEGP